MLQQHVVRPLGCPSARAIGKKERSQRIDFGKAMFVRFHRAGARKRSADKTETDRIELPRWQLRRRVARPETVPIARDNREAGDLLATYQVVYLGALPVGRAVVAAAH